MWIADSAGGFSTTSYGGTLRYVHNYFRQVDDDILKRLRRYPSSCDLKEAMFKAKKDANFLAKCLQFSKVTSKMVSYGTAHFP